jgi:uncharacterized protein YcfJ
MTVAKNNPDWKWITSTAITVAMIAGGFIFTRGQDTVRAQDTIQRVEKLEKCTADQSNINKDLTAMLYELKIAITELRGEIKMKKDRE